MPRKGIIKIKYNLELKSGIPLSKDIVLSYFFTHGPRMQNKIKQAMDALVHHDEQLMDMHGEGILEGGYTRASLDQWESSMIRVGKLETTKQRFYLFFTMVKNGYVPDWFAMTAASHS